MRLKATLALIGLSALILGGCNRNPFMVEITDCPGVAFVKGTNSLTRIAPDRPGNAEDIEFTAALTGLRATCDDKIEGVKTDVRFQILVKQVMAGLPQTVEVPYFVAVVKDGQEMVSKEIYTARLRIDPESQRGGIAQSFSQRIPTNALAAESDYEILIGFQLSEAEAAYNVRNFGTR